MADEDPTADEIAEQLDQLEATLQTANTEATLDDVEAQLTAIQADLDALPETERQAALTDRAADIETDIEDRRGPYPEEVLEQIEATITRIETEALTERGRETVATAIAEFRADQPALSATENEPNTDEKLIEQLEAITETIEGLTLHPDHDQAQLDTLLAGAETLHDAVENAEIIDDLSVREQLEVKGFYDSIDQPMDFPPELSAIKAWERQGEAEPILLAFQALDSTFMEEYCMEALGRLRATAAVDELIMNAKRRNETAIEALGKIGDEAAVDPLVGHLESDQSLQIASLHALGQIGSSEAIEPVVARLNDEETSVIVRSVAARTLGLIGDPQTIEPLAATLSGDAPERVKASAAWALAQIQTKRALATLEEAADTGGPLVQAEAQAVIDG